MADILPFRLKIYLNSQINAVSLYERYGFVKEGEIFYEAGLAHYKMILKLIDD